MWLWDQRDEESCLAVVVRWRSDAVARVCDQIVWTLMGGQGGLIDNVQRVV